MKPSDLQPLFIKPIDYQIDSAALVACLTDLPRLVFLDSNFPSNNSQRFDIISAAPTKQITTRDKITEVNSTTTRLSFTSNPFQILKSELNLLSDADPGLVDLPFYGGAIGYFGYDLARYFYPFKGSTKNDIDIPDMDIGIYLWALIRDHKLSRAYFVAHPDCPLPLRRDVLKRLAQYRTEAHKPFRVTSPFQSNLTRCEYDQKYQEIINYIRAGDCYQVNFSQRFHASYTGDEWTAYLRLRASTDAPFSAFIKTQDCTLLCLSPERFIQLQAGKVETRPIKGTRPRSDNPQKDLQYAQLLRNSPKDIAENLMIVDLLRNDLSKNCQLGSVSVPALFEVEAYSNVYHLVSTILGELSPDKHALDLLEGAFPGGSITGAPKKRAMEIIEELEPHRRTIYCGSIGYINCNGDMDTNIAIRTVACKNNTLYCWGGGGIVSDSDAENEYHESYVKVAHLMKILTSIKCFEQTGQANDRP
jgi:para-aminobenzoate synthetase component 1